MPLRPCDNPFRAQRIESLPFEPQAADWPTLDQRLHDLHHRAAIVGPEGSGKTTLLRELGQRLASAGWRTRWMQLTLDRRQFTRAMADTLTRDLGPRDVILFDGAGHLPLPRWWAFRRRARPAGGLIITAHTGRRLPLLLQTHTDPALLESLVARLLDHPSAANPRPPAPSQADIAALFRRHNGNIRDALRDLYDRCAE